MASMRDIRSRIKSVKDTQQITKAMNLIASAKLKKARKQLNDTLPYFEKIQETLDNILDHSGDIEHRYLQSKDTPTGKRAGFLVITADKGLCGSYNHNVIRLAENVMKNYEERYLFVIGHMGREYFTRKKYPIDIEFMYTAQNPTLHRTREIAGSLISLYNEGALDEIYVVYTHMISALKQEPSVIKLLPIEHETLKQAPKKNETYHHTITYDPSPQQVLDSIIPIFAKGIVFGSLVESYCSEQSARMTAMDSATTAADDMLSELTFLYNRARQAAITQELSEIIGGANAQLD